MDSINVGVLADPTPNIVRIKLLSKRLREKLCNSFFYLLEKASGKVDFDFNSAASSVTKYLDATYPLSLLSAYHERVYFLMKQGDIKGITQVINSFIEIDVKREPLSLIYHHSDKQKLSILEQTIVSSVVQNVLEGTYKKPFVFEAPKAEDRTKFNSEIKKALEAIEILDPLLLDEIKEVVDFIWVYKTSALNAATSIATCGIVHIREFEAGEHWTRLLEHIVHEAAHLNLYILMTHDPIFIFERDQATELYASPFRIADRPVSAIYHAMFVLARTVCIFNLLKQHSLFADSLSSIRYSYNERESNVDFTKKFNEAYRIIRENAKLTEIGESLLSNCAAMVNISEANYLQRKHAV
jgi:hypothetical protein